ncbi:MAG: glycosyltransferase [Candidatus Parvarchaeota archaeon]|nr:glycosyltransferase [Candidatus Rehaiarchaeum fermentans]
MKAVIIKYDIPLIAGISTYQNSLISDLISHYPSKFNVFEIKYKYKLKILNRIIDVGPYKSELKDLMKENAIWLTFPSVSSDFFLGARYKIVTIHDTYYFLSPSIKRKIYIFLFNLKNKFKRLANYDKIIAISELTKDYLIKDFSFPEEKIEVIYPFISKDYFNKYNKKSNNQKIIIGWINNNNFNKIKKLFEFLNLFIKYAPNNFEVHIYGKDIPVNSFVKKDKRIKYFGFLPEEKKIDTYLGFDYYLSTSIIEGFGYPIMYAKALKIPVLLYDGKIPEISRRNTIIWNENSINNEFFNSLSKGVNNNLLEKAYNDALLCTFEKQKDKVEKIINELK